MIYPPKSWKLTAQKEINRIKKSLSSTQKIELLKGMMLTRAVDNALKAMFLSGEMTYQGIGFQGKGFRSLGQEAIFGAMFLLRIGKSFIDNQVYTGDLAAPLIRDLGVFLAMSDGDVETALNAQAGKIGKPCDGRDLHLGDFSKGIITPAAPLAIATCTLIGLAQAYKIKKQSRVAVSFIGEGGSSLGEWHEAINFAAVNALPMIFCIENNQTALSTPTHAQSRVKSFADKGIGYGINALVVDGNDIEEVTATFSFAAEYAREHQCPVLIEVVTMRMCGHAHHDDMLYLGHDPILSFSIPNIHQKGYVNEELYAHWRERDPIKNYQEKLIKTDVINAQNITLLEKEMTVQVEQARTKVREQPWPGLHKKSDDDLVFLSPWIFIARPKIPVSFNREGINFMSALALGVKESFIAHKNCLMIGEDVAPPYGNAFMMFKPIMDEYADRFINTPISENAIVGACVGLAMGGMLPIGEMQFNDFVASCMNQLVNNAAKSFFRTHINLPMVLRMPFGGLRRAGPYHSQDTAAWFYRTPGLKIMAPSTPLDAFLMIEKAVRDPDPVLFYEHIALYRDPKIKQDLSLCSTIDIEGAQYLRRGSHITLISYGAYVHIVNRIADKLDKIRDVKAEVIDLRYLQPLDMETIASSIKKTSRVMLIGEDCLRGSIMESLASNIATDLFAYLDAPPTVLGSRNTPIPYAPSLEDEYLLQEEHIMSAVLNLMKY